VRDISHPESAQQAADVAAILETLGVGAAVARIEVWNKVDLLGDEARAALLAQDARRGDVQAASATSGEGLAPLLALIAARLAAASTAETLHLAPDDGRRRAWLHNAGVVLREDQGARETTLQVRWSARQKAEFARL
jgi:GTP-binding protein HflX